MSIIEKLKPLRAYGQAVTVGLDDATIERFAATDDQLVAAIDAAAAEFVHVQAQFPELLKLAEVAQIATIQQDFVNFYAADNANPYVALAARGAWIVTLKGAVIYDAGGYGMLGLGHTPKAVLDVMAKPQVMANIMTPNLAQLRLTQALKKEIGQNKPCPYHAFMCLNSGSESVSLASRIIDTNAKTQTDEGARHAGKTIKRLVVKGAFHGRTDRPALYSDSSRKTYVQYLASYRNENSVISIPPYDTDALKAAFSEAEANGWFIEALFLEPVMGEGNPGRAVPREFYDVARRLTKEHGALFLIDSIQAGLRATGYLSIVDYPAFDGIDPPDMETYSKAINAGQYPLSILAVNEKTAAIYRRGLYGNTMTANPRALEIGATVLATLDDALRSNIQVRGAQAVEKLNALKDKLGGAITNVQGTGLLFSCELDKRYKAYGAGSVEEWLRLRGIGVIHGGENALRFTPHFAMSEAELDLLVDMIEQALSAV